jgi:hypothetical protein
MSNPPGVQLSDCARVPPAVTASSSSNTAVCLIDDLFIVSVLRQPCTSVTHKPGDAAEAAASSVVPGLVVPPQAATAAWLAVVISSVYRVFCCADARHASSITGNTRCVTHLPGLQATDARSPAVVCS